jgi:hypothetical protein
MLPTTTKEDDDERVYVFAVANLKEGTGTLLTSVMKTTVGF